MRLESCKQLIGIVSAASLVIMTGCATQGSTTNNSDSQAAQAATIPEDQSSPSIPVAATEVVPVEKAEEKKTPEQPPKPGSVASVLKKMNENPFTLYWREKNSYSYHIGSVLDAEYKPGEGLVVKAKQEDTSIVCEFNEAGKLVNVNIKEGAKDQCSEIMFTLDLELGE